MSFRLTPLPTLLFGLFLGCSGATGGIMEGAGDPTVSDPPPEEPPVEEDGGAPVEGTDAGKPKTDSGTSTGKDTGTPPPSDTGTPPPPPADTGPPPSDPPVTGLPLIANLGISEVAFFQGVKVSVAKSGAKATHTADVIAGREALVRVYVTPKAGWSAAGIKGELKLISAAGGTKTYSATLTPSAASTDASLTSTLNFSVPTGVLAPDTKYSVALYAATGGGTGDTSGAQYPAGGATESLDAKSTGEVLKIKIVPVQYNADGTGRLPDVSAAQIERYRKAFYAMFPAKNVEVTVRAPYAWSSAVSPNGSGFSTLLQALVKLRAADGAPKDVYYYGAFMATSSFSSYCSGGCVTGLCGLLTYPSDATGRACVGVGFPGTDSASTAAHEIGHAHGRAHAPCGTGDADGSYPYSGGSIGSWGYDLVDKKLFSPSTVKDFMGYCSPSWISDYTYKAIATRMTYVNGGADMVFPFDAPRNYRFVAVGGDGKLTWGERVELQEPPMAEPHTVKYVDATGTVLETATGAYYPYDDMPGGYMLVPEGPATAVSVAVTGMATAGIESRLSRFAP